MRIRFDSLFRSNPDGYFTQCKSLGRSCSTSRYAEDACLRHQASSFSRARESKYYVSSSIG